MGLLTSILTLRQTCDYQSVSNIAQWSHLTNKVTPYIDILAGDLGAVPAEHAAAQGLGVAALEVKVGGPLPVVHAPVRHVVHAAAVELHMNR